MPRARSSAGATASSPQSYIARAIPPLFEKLGGKDMVSAVGGEFRYAVPAHQVEYIRGARGIEVGAWRGVGAGYTKFAVETVLDEVAAHRNIDPLDLRLALLKGDPRAVKVLQTVAEMAGWTQKRQRGPRPRTRLFGCARDLYGGGGGSLASISKAEPSGCTASGPRSMPAWRCSRRTSWRRWKAP